MQKHGFVALLVGRMLLESRTPALDLYAASSLLLDMLDVRSAMSNDLSPEVEAWKRLKTNWNAFLGPFALDGSGQRGGKTTT